MKLLLRSIAILLWIGIGMGIERFIPTSEYQEVLGEITEIDKINSGYKVKFDNRLVTVETKLPLPQPNKQIIILLPK